MATWSPQFPPLDKNIEICPVSRAEVGDMSLANTSGELSVLDIKIFAPPPRGEQRHAHHCIEATPHS
jgi:hypothetical protein